MRLHSLLSAAFLTLVALLAGGCNTVSIDTKQYLGLPTYAPTNPATVTILREPPVRPHERLGEVMAEPTGNPSVQQIETKMSDAAAKWGANAVVLVSDRTQRTGVIVSGPWYGRQVSAQYQRYIVGVAIRYTTPPVPATP